MSALGVAQLQQCGYEKVMLGGKEEALRLREGSSVSVLSVGKLHAVGHQQRSRYVEDVGVVPTSAALVVPVVPEMTLALVVLEQEEYGV